MKTPALTPPGLDVLAFDDELRGPYAVLLCGETRVLLHARLVGEIAAAFARRVNQPPPGTTAVFSGDGATLTVRTDEEPLGPAPA